MISDSSRSSAGGSRPQRRTASRSNSNSEASSKDSLLEISPATSIPCPTASPWRKRREWRWDEIERVSYSRLNRWLILYGPRHETIRAAFALAGIRELAQSILKHVSGMKLAAARTVLDRLARL